MVTTLSLFGTDVRLKVIDLKTELTDTWSTQFCLSCLADSSLLFTHDSILTF